MWRALHSDSDDTAKVDENIQFYKTLSVSHYFCVTYWLGFRETTPLRA